MWADPEGSDFLASGLWRNLELRCETTTVDRCEAEVAKTRAEAPAFLKIVLEGSEGGRVASETSPHPIVWGYKHL